MIKDIKSLKSSTVGPVTQKSVAAAENRPTD